MNKLHHSEKVEIRCISASSNESLQDRTNEFIGRMQELGHTIYDVQFSTAAYEQGGMGVIMCSAIIIYSKESMAR
jgi:hypothetical protein